MLRQYVADFVKSLLAVVVSKRNCAWLWFNSTPLQGFCSPSLCPVSGCSGC
jgi:hypothetical protein